MPVPEVGKERDLTGREGGNYMIFGCSNDPFGGVDQVVTLGDIMYWYFTVAEQLVEKVGLFVIHDNLGDGVGMLGEEGTERDMSKATWQSTVAHSTNKHKLGTVGKG